MSHTLALLIAWAGPPLLGALVGCLAAWIMTGAFLRSATRRTASGARQGTPPLLARWISRCVSRELLSEERLRVFVSSAPSAQGLRASVGGVTEAVLSRSPSQLITSLTRTPLPSLEAPITRAVKGLLGSRGLIHAVREAATRIVDSLGARPLREVLAAVKAESLVTDKIIPMLVEERNRSSISRGAATFLAGQAERVVTDEVLEGIPGLLTPIVPDAVERVIQWLRSAQTRAYLAEQGRVLLPKLLEKLNVLQKLFLSAASFDRRIDEKMPEIVDELLLALERMVRDPSQQQRVLGLIRDVARDWRDGLLVRGAGSGAPSVTRKELEDALAGLIERVLAAGEDPAARGAVYNGLLSALRVDQQTLGGFIRQAAGLSETMIADGLATAALTWLTAEGAAERVGRALAGAAERRLADQSNTPLRDIVRIDDARKREIDDGIAARLLGIIPTAVPRLLKGVDLDSLAARALESLVARGEVGSTTGGGTRLTRWACVCGASLGCVIGLSMLLLRLAPAM